MQFDTVQRSCRRFIPGPCSRSAPPRPVNTERAFDARSLTRMSSHRCRPRSARGPTGRGNPDQVGGARSWARRGPGASSPSSVVGTTGCWRTHPRARRSSTPWPPRRLDEVAQVTDPPARPEENTPRATHEAAAVAGLPAGHGDVRCGATAGLSGPQPSLSQPEPSSSASRRYSSGPTTRTRWPTSPQSRSRPVGTQGSYGPARGRLLRLLTGSRGPGRPGRSRACPVSRHAATTRWPQ